MTRQLRSEDYTVGWVCALPVELAAAEEMLDEEHETPQCDPHDTNIYTCGRIGEHNVVIACLPEGQMGTNSAAAVAVQMKSTFTSTRFGLMVGIGGGVPSKEIDVRLGDVVVSKPHTVHGGVVQYDFGKTNLNGFERTGSLNSPPTLLLNAVASLQAKHMRRKGRLLECFSKLNHLPEFGRDAAGLDVLFKAEYDHEGGATCEKCNQDNIVDRETRRQDVIVHYGTIASGNLVMKNASQRDKISAALGGVLCFEMEAAGLMNSFPCLVIRGICDYADSHKNKRWQAYASGTAAAYAKELLLTIPAADVMTSRPTEEATDGLIKRSSQHLPPNCTSSKRRKFDVLNSTENDISKERAITLPISHQKRSRTYLNDEQIHCLLESLRFKQIDARQMTIKTAHAKTCKWLLKNPHYLNWLDATKLDEHHGFLWIKGKPGTGKSTLVKFALDNAQKRMKDRTIISFFFNARGEDMEKSTIGTYRSLLLQLLERLPALQCVFDSGGLSSSSIRPDHQWGIESLKSLLEQAIQSLGQSSVVCFIDALDECEEEQVRDMIQFFERVGELSVSGGIRFQVCFSSRHYPHITIRRGLSLVLEGQEGHSQDIANYLESELKIGKTKIAQQTRSDLQEKASGVFMWVVLVVGILNKEHDRGRIHALRKRLQEIPGDLHKLFRDILTRDSHNRDELVLCIQWVLFAKQPLSPEQLYFAVLSGVESEALSKWDPDEITKDSIKLFILDSSKGLAEITTSKNRTVQFIHESVRDFLLKEDGLADVWPNLRSNLQGQSHEQLKQCCLTYISMDVFTPLRIPNSLPKASLQQAADLRKSASDMFPFLEYAVQNVLHHADLAEGSGITQGSFIQSFPLTSWIQLNNLFEKHEVRRHTEEMSLLYALGERNLSSLVRAHPSAISCLEVGKERYGPPLFAALATRSEEALRAFIDALSQDQLPGSCLNEIQARYYENREDQNLGRNFQFSNQRGVLSYLAELGNEAIVRLLLETGKADVNAQEKYGRTPLSWAAKNGHEAVVKLLLETGKADVHAQEKYGRTPLSWAAENGHEAVVKLLLETGKVDVNTQDRNFGHMPLWWAAKNGHEAVVKLLLETSKVDVAAQDKYGRTPLSWAAKNGHEAVVKLLLETGKVDVDAQDEGGRTPLSWAVENGRETVVKLLLETGKVDVNAQDEYGRTPLSWATENGHEAVVKLLLETGKADVHAQEKYGRTPLSWAAENGHEAVVKLLLETGKVDVNTQDRIFGHMPLSWAAKNGHEAVVKLLLETGNVDVDAQGRNFGQMPLWWAAKNGHEAVVKLLLEMGKVDVAAQDGDGRTPLSWAAENGHETVVKLLLETGKADVNAQDEYGRTPLSWATENGHEAVVKLLLETGKVDVDAQDNFRRTPLWWAAKNGHETVVKLLLETGKVDVDAQDRINGRTPLSWAAENGHEAVVKLLEVYRLHSQKNPN